MKRASLEHGHHMPVTVGETEFIEGILTELSEREWTMDAEQSAICDVTITNGGSIVAAFEVRITRINPH